MSKAAGVLLHITSLPSKYGIGDFGPQAYKFADFLKQAKQTYWQILPLNPPAPIGDYSPYNCLSAFAGNTLLISPELLYKDGLLKNSDIQTKLPEGPVDFSKAAPFKTELLNLAFKNFQIKNRKGSFQDFCHRHKDWLDDYALFIALRQKFHNQSWADWPEEIRDRNKKALQSIRQELSEPIDKEKVFQYLFFKQYGALKKYCNQRNIKIFGDMPIYVSHDSAEVWTNPKMFKLDENKKPKFVSGVPPDYFSSTGQLWGNPVYNWNILKKTGYQWWFERIVKNLELYDIVRLDHFRGFIRYWQIHAGQNDASKGYWVKVPSMDFFTRLLKIISREQLIIEDLGYVTAEVEAVIKKFNLMRMKILIAGLGGDPKNNPHHIKNHVPNSAVYTGTHDTNTLLGWFENEIDENHRKAIYRQIGRRILGKKFCWEMIKLAYSSKSRLAVIPMQDILCLGTEARMNVPGTTEKNWIWRLKSGKLTKKTAQMLKNLTVSAGRIRS